MRFAYNPTTTQVELWSGAVKLAEFDPTAYELRQAILANNLWNQPAHALIAAYNAAIDEMARQSPDHEVKSDTSI